MVVTVDPDHLSALIPGAVILSPKTRSNLPSCQAGPPSLETVEIRTRYPAMPRHPCEVRHLCASSFSRGSHMSQSNLPPERQQ